MFNILLLPFEWVLSFFLEVFFSLTASYGLSIILMSLAVNLLLLPAYNWTNRIKDKEKQLQKRMKPEIDKIKRASKGASSTI